MTKEKTPNLQTLPIDRLVEDYRLYPRSEVDGATVEQFREALRAGAKFPPIRVCSKSFRVTDFFLPLERVEKLERLSAGRGSAPALERNVPRPKPEKPSKLVEKSMDTISQLTWTTSLLRCIREGHVNEGSEELRHQLEELSEALGEFLSRPRTEEPANAPPVSKRLY